MENSLLKSIGIIGVIFFAPLFVLTFSDPHAIENAGKFFVESRLTEETKQKIDAISLPRTTQLELLLGVKAKEHRENVDSKLNDLKRKLHEDLPLVLAREIAKLRNLDCACRHKWEQQIRNSMELKIISYENSLKKLVEFSHTKYMEIVNQLTNDIRTFLGVNLFIFLILLAVSFMKPQAGKHLLLPSGLMVISMAFCSYFYLFEQNWFYTIIYNDYTGFSYLGYLIVVFGFLCDIAFNRAKITTEILNACLNAIGSAASVVPC